MVASRRRWVGHLQSLLSVAWSRDGSRRRTSHRPFLGVFLAAALAACTFGGVVEFEAYKSAFDKVQTTSSSLLDQLAQQERWLFFARYKNARSPDVFNPALARYYTDSVDPPGTAHFRAALDTIKTYNDLLYGLETGQTADAMAVKVNALQSSLSSAATSATGLIGIALPGPMANVQAAIATLNGVFGELQPFLALALKARSREEFHDFLIQSYPTVRKLLLELRNSTRYMFPLLTAAVTDQAFRTTGRLTQADQDKIDVYRKLLADWVVLLEVTVKALDAAYASAIAPPTLGGSVTGLTTVATELDTAAQSARKNLATLATK